MHDEIDERCSRVRELMASAVETEPSTEDRSACEAHLRDCEDCRTAASWLELATELAKNAPSPDELPEPRMERVIEAVMARIEREPAVSKPPRRRIWSYAPAMASLAALSVLAFVLLRTPDVEQLLPTGGPSLSENRSRPDADASGGRVEELEPKPQQLAAEAPSDRLSARRQSSGKLSPGEESSPPQPTAAPATAATREEKSAGLEDRAPERGPSPQPEGLDEVAQKSSASAGLAAPQAYDDAELWPTLGEREPANAVQADSLRIRLEERLQNEKDAELQQALRAALRELDRLWPQDSEDN